MGLLKATAPDATDDFSGAMKTAEAVERLDDPTPDVRRDAARSLSGAPGSEGRLLARLEVETDASAREAMLIALMRLASVEAAQGLARLMRSEDAGLRNAAIETLATMPRAAETLVDDLLADSDPDVRILACNLAHALPLPRVKEWLTNALSDPHPNVCAAAVDGLAEVGDAACAPHLRAMTARFPDDAFLEFAVRAVLQRIGVS